MELTVAIAGAGLGGLCLARRLLRAASTCGCTRVIRRLVTGFHPLVGRLIDGADDEAAIMSTFAVGSRPAGWPLARATLPSQTQ